MTNAILNVLVVAALALGFGTRLRRLRPGPLVVTALVMLVLTIVFDTLMIAVGLYEYSPDRILGIYVAGAPLEDLAYPIAAVLAMPALWSALGARRGRAVGVDVDGPSARPSSSNSTGDGAGDRPDA